MYMFAKARTNIAILALYLFAWVIIGAGAFAFIAYQVVDISIPLLVGGGIVGGIFGIVGGIFGIVGGIMGILDVGNNQRWPYSNGLISNALNRTSVDVPESPTGLALPAPAEVEPWRRAQEESSTRKDFYEALPRFRECVIAEIKKQYGKHYFLCEPASDVVVFPPKEIYRREDLLRLEIVGWLVQNGWQWDKEERITYYKLILTPQTGEQLG